MKNKGFTLAEMMIVMAVAVVMASAAIHFTGGQMEAARIQECQIALSASLNDASLKALEQHRNGGGLTVAETSPEILQPLQRFQKYGGAEITLSCGGTVVITADGLPQNPTSILYTFDENGAIVSVTVNETAFYAT